MKTRKPAAKAKPLPAKPHPLEAQLLLYREALRRAKQRAAGSIAELPIDDEMLSES